MQCMRTLRGLSVVTILHAGAALAESGPFALPAEGDCAASRVPVSVAAAPPSYVVGDVVTREKLEALRPLLPPELWEQREHFFFDGMQMELGPCFRRYAPPDFFAEVTRAESPSSRLLENGGLEAGRAGLPFDPASLTADDPEVGQKWAWNASRRWQAGGQFGEVRLVYVDGGKTTVRIVGDHFLALLEGRADLPVSGYRIPWARGERWVAGGRSRDPSAGGRCAFRQLRASEADANPALSDGVFFFSSEMQKPERVGWDPESPLVTCAYARGYYLPRGGKVGRYRWKLVGVQDLVAPINGRLPAYPAEPERDFGPAGASLASERWELRRAIVLEAANGDRTLRQYLDLETLFPLYLVDGPTVIQNAGRWSGDRPGYPALREAPTPDPRVLDAVIGVMASKGSSEVVRVEAWESVALPPDGKPLRSLISTEALARER